jgi:hypothetical protein
MKLETSVVALFLLTAGLLCCDTAAVINNAAIRRKKINARERKNLRRGVQFSQSVSNSPISVSSGDSTDDSTSSDEETPP